MLQLRPKALEPAVGIEPLLIPHQTYMFLLNLPIRMGMALSCSPFLPGPDGLSRHGWSSRTRAPDKGPAGKGKTIGHEKIKIVWMHLDETKCQHQKTGDLPHMYR